MEGFLKALRTLEYMGGRGRGGQRKARERSEDQQLADRSPACLAPDSEPTHGSRLRATVSNHKSQEGLPLSFHPSPKVRPSFLWAVPPPGKKGLSDAVSYY